MIRRLAFPMWVLCLALYLPSSLMAQEPGESADKNPYGSGLGLQILLTNHGFGLGGYYSRGLSSSSSFIMDFNLGAGKDEQELKFFSRFGDGIIPNKRNYLLMLPVHAGFQKRLFREHIEDNFRPYLHATGGPVFGWEYPYFRDRNSNGRYDEDFDEERYDVIGGIPKGHMKIGFGGTVALGAYFGLSRRVTQGVRFGYTFTYFKDGIQLLEAPKEPQRYFGSPVISITFGRLF